MNRFFASAGAAALMLALASSAGAAVIQTNGDYTLDSTSFGSFYGVHATDQSGTSILGTIGNTADTVTLSSGDILNSATNGQGEATFEGPFNDLLLTFSAPYIYSGLSFGFTDVAASGGTFDISVNGSTIFSNIALSGSNLQNFSLISTGNTFHTVGFTFDPAVQSAKQLRLEVGDPVGTPFGGVPEPSTWALMIIGLAGIGAMLRRHRQSAAIA